ncbi:MAG: hypothetical protein K9G58_10580 [Bacteroidales bacterium]|nr:hypothetical protein [Bacteroidales bacterium]MCF8386544.1 hypothetical protein [Bacteroidales bacterium]MCF8398607.1 hypothetical protein [Bacteroidales bacterium]
MRPASKIQHYLQQHKTYAAIILLLYYLLVVLPHEWFGKQITAVFDEVGRETYQAVMLGIALLFILLYFVAIRKLLIKRKDVISYVSLLVLLILTVISYPLIIIHYIEAIHFLQYAILGFLLFPLLRNYYQAIFWGLMLGFLDEGYQHFYLDPKSPYFDFNDIVLNQIGLAWGLLPIAFNAKSKSLREMQDWRSRIPIFATILTITLCIVILIKTNVLSILPDPAHPLNLIKEPPKAFWTSISHLDVRYHIIMPLEGLIVIAILYFYFCASLTKIHNTKALALEKDPDKC